MAGDVVELILADHRKFEALLRDIRSTGANRSEALGELAAVLVAHAEAEEAKVYPQLRHRDAIDREESEHGRHEHAEGHEALLRLLEVGDPSHEDFGDALEKLTEELSHHIDEEERTILNPAREEITEDVRKDLGVAFMTERQRQLDGNCGSIENIRTLVEAARAEGHL